MLPLVVVLVFLIALFGLLFCLLRSAVFGLAFGLTCAAQVGQRAARTTAGFKTQNLNGGYTVCFLQKQANVFVKRRRYVFPHVISTNGKLAMAAIDQHRKLHAGRPSYIHERIECGTDGTASEEHVVHQDKRLTVDGERDFRGMNLGLI